MEPINKLTSTAVPLPLPNIDTDQIIPKQFLKRIERTGYEDFLFYDWRYNLDVPDDVSPNKDFVLNNPAYGGSQILILRALHAAVVVTRTNYNVRGTSLQTQDVLEKYVLPTLPCAAN